MKKRLLILLLALIVVSSGFVNPIFAEDVQYKIIKENETIIPEEVRLKERTKQVKEFEEKLKEEIEPHSQYSYEYKTEYSPIKYVTVSGELGGQPPGGSQFESGGGFYYSRDGGPTVTANVSIGLPEIPSITFGVSLGYVTEGVSGYFINVPDRINHYKAYAEKTYEVQVVASYRRLRHSNDPWKLYTQTPLITLYSQAFSAKKV